MAKPRNIMRIEVGPGTPEGLNKAVDRFLSTHASVQTRVIEWLVKEADEVTRAAILGLYPLDIRRELPKRLIQKMRE